MSEREIDIEKDHLVIFRDSKGAFSHFYWYWNKDRKELEKMVAEFNMKKPEERNGTAAALEDGRLVREICAYREAAEPLEAIKRNAARIRNYVDSAINDLDSAMDSLRNIKEI
ncbi:MAG: hypothetical protein LBK61_05695 [Spirochaetaceae bacterium]|jgi:hypothetical protein|nr:hypothetical protein [Spirochaetaceae bacterium]